MAWPWLVLSPSAGTSAVCQEGDSLGGLRTPQPPEPRVGSRLSCSPPGAKDLCGWHSGALPHQGLSDIPASTTQRDSALGLSGAQFPEAWVP